MKTTRTYADVMGDAIARVVAEHGMAIDDDGKLLDAVVKIHPRERAAAGGIVSCLLHEEGFVIQEMVPYNPHTLSMRLMDLVNRLYDAKRNAADIPEIAKALTYISVELKQAETVVTAQAPQRTGSGLPADVRRPADKGRRV